jgi:hypothetical protein
VTPVPGRVGQRLVGRAEELAVVETALERALAGTGSPLVITGEPGVGKTALVEAACAAAASRGVRAAFGRCWSADGTPPHWLWQQVLRALGGAAPDGIGAPGSPPASVEGVAARVAAALADHAAATPLIVCLEDIEQGAPEAVRALPLVAARLAGAPVLVVATAQRALTRARGEVREVLDALLRTGEHLPLRGLDPEGVRALLGSHHDRSPPDRLVEQLHRATAGNPLLVSVLARAAADTGALEGLLHGPPPEELRAHVRRQTDALPDPARALLDVAAALSRSTSLPEVAAVAGETAEAVRTALAPAIADGLLVEDGATLRFRHDLIRASLYADLEPVRRVALHRAAAARLGGVGDAPDRAGAVAHHAFHGSIGEPTREVLDGLLRAAGEAARVGDADEAASLLGHAAACAESCGAPIAERGRILLDLAVAEERAALPAAAERSWGRAAAAARMAGDAELLGRVAVAAARSALLVGTAAAPHVRLLEEALEAIGAEPTSLRAQILGHLGAALYWSPERPGSVALTDESLVVARSCGDPMARVVALLARHFVTRGPGMAAWRAGLAEEAVRAADAVGDDDLSVLARSALAVDHREQGEALASRAAVADLEAFSAARGHTVGLWTAAAHRLVDALLDGDIEAAAGHRRRLDRYAVGHREVASIRDLVDAMTSLDPLPDRLRARVATRAERRSTPAWRARALLAAIEAGDDDVAGDLAALVALLGRPRQEDTHWLLGVALAAEAAALLDDADQARAIAALLRPHAGSYIVAGRVGACRGVVHHHLGLLARTAGDADAALAHLLAAERAHDRPGFAQHLVRTRAALAALRSADAPVQAAAPARLRREGGYWSIRSPDRGLTLPDAKGLRLLAHLVAAPHVSVGALELHRLDGAGAAVTTPGGAGASGELGADGGGADALLDDAAKRAYRRRLRDIADEREQALALRDGERAIRLEEEAAAIAAILSQGVGLGGRDRRMPSEAERARTSVTKALRGTVDRIRAADPDLGAHLDASLQTGARCCYAPPGPALLVPG